MCVCVGRYDFSLFGIFADEIGLAFFPTGGNAFLSRIQAFSVFAGAFVMRPVGGVFFGWIGDTCGRVTSLRLTILMMACPTVCIGLLPTHDDIGIAAPLLLSLLRAMQGLAAGGELPTALVYALEAAPRHHHGLVGGLVQATGVGSLLASAVAALMHALLTDEQMEAWGWRLPFLSGLILLLVGFVLRRGLQSSQEFLEAKDADDRPPSPVVHVFKHHLHDIARFIGANGVSMSWYYAVFVWLPSWLYQKFEWAFAVNAISLIAYALTVAASGRSVDKYNLDFGWTAVKWAALCVVVAPLSFWALSGDVTFAHVLFGQLALAVASGGFVAPLQGWMFHSLEHSEITIRCSIMGIAYNAGAVLLAGTAPVVSTSLASTALGGMAVSVYMAGMACVSVLTLALYESNRALEIGRAMTLALCNSSHQTRKYQQTRRRSGSEDFTDGGPQRPAPTGPRRDEEIELTFTPLHPAAPELAALGGASGGDGGGGASANGSRGDGGHRPPGRGSRGDRAPLVEA